MFVHQVAYAPDASGMWSLKTISGLGQRFTSRFAALAFATRDAAERVRAGAAVVIRVEGADGVWRAFDAGMKGMPLPAARAG
jgi:hypothetical protein